jgi:hypothetical protein
MNNCKNVLEVESNDSAFKLIDQLKSLEIIIFHK